ncbi:hypothetical protein AQ876_02380 [Burkholderia pseudomallei]|nr:hypothetical protein AQ876_02380 [Burkholderia pseudomallei]
MPVNPNQRTARSRTRQSCRTPRAIAALGAHWLRRQSRGKPASAGTGHNKAAAACAIEKPLRQAAS